MKKKILYIHHAKGWGGAPNAMIRLINSLDKDKYEAHVLLIQDSIVSKFLEEYKISYSVAQCNFYKKRYYCHGFTMTGYIHWYKVLSFIKIMVLWFLSREYFAEKEIEKFDADIIHLNSSVLTDWLKPCAKKASVIMHIREGFAKGDFGIRYSFLRNQMDRYAKRIIAISKDNLTRINIPVKSEYVYDYAEEFSGQVNPTSYNSKVFLYVGGLAPMKGFYTLIDALEYLEDGIKVYFAGNYGTEPKSLKHRIKRMIVFWKKKHKYMKKLKNKKNAKIIGLVNNISDHLNESSCLVSPFSLPHFSLPIIEAFAHKKTVIVSNIEGTEEVVKDGYNGVLFEVNDARKLANKMNYIANNPKIAQKLGVNGYRDYKAKFQLSNMERISEIYKEVLNA